MIVTFFGFSESNDENRSGFATVADKPIARASGLACRHLARLNDNKSPLFVPLSACISSMIMVLMVAKSDAASGHPSINSKDSGVVNKICGGLVRCLFRLDCGVSPVRDSIVMGSPISVTGRIKLRSMSVAKAFNGEM